MGYRFFRAGALFLLIVLFILISDAVRKERVKTVSVQDETPSIVETLDRSVDLINSIEYKVYNKSSNSGGKGGQTETHIYYKKPGLLRVETKNSESTSVDIYTSEGMYEYFPDANTAYFREKWKDEKPVNFQLMDKIEDISIRGKYRVYKSDKIGDINCEIIRSVDDFKGKIYEHRIWVTTIDKLHLPLKEEYFVDGDMTMTNEYEYISINKDVDINLFVLNQPNLKIIKAEGIPKVVKDEKEAEKYVKFNVIIPEYTPKDFTMSEICVIPPLKTPSALISYTSGDNTICFSQKNIHKNVLEANDEYRIITAVGKKFALLLRNNETVSIKWVDNNIEYEVSGPYLVKDEVKNLVHAITGIWIWIQ